MTLRSNPIPGVFTAKGPAAGRTSGDVNGRDRVRARLLVASLLLGAFSAVRADEAPPAGKAKARAAPAQAVADSAAPSLLRFVPKSQRLPQTLQRVSTMAFSPDGKYLASGHGWYEREGSIQVWEVESGKRVGLEMFPIGVSSIDWTPDGKRIAASVWDSTVRVYDFPGLEQKTRIAIDRSANRLGISPDGRQIMTAAEGYAPVDDSRGRVVQIWDAATGGLVRKCESEDDLFRLGCAAWSPKGKYVAAAGGYMGKRQALGRLWFADTGKEAARLGTHPGYAHAIRFFPDDSRVATAGIDGTLRIWESATGKLLSQIDVGATIDGLDISRDGTLLASGTDAGQISLWDPREGKEIADLSNGGPAVVAVAFSPDGKMLASGGADAVIRLWNVPDRKLDHELPAIGDSDRPGRPLILAPARDGEFVIAAFDTGAIHAFDVGREKEIWKSQSPRGESPTAVAVAPDKKHALVGCENGAVRLHAARDGAVLLELKHMPAKISAVAFAGEGPLLAAGDAEGRVWLWDQGGKALRAERHDHQGAVRAIGFPEKARLVTSIGADGTAICRQTDTGKKSAEARVSDGPVTSALISADGSTALVLGQRLETWDAVQLTLDRNARVLLDSHNALALSADGSNVLVNHALGTFVEGPQEGIMAAARVTDSREAGVIVLSADDHVLFKGTESGALLVWQTLPPRQSPLARIRRVGNAVALATSPDGKWLAAGGDDTQVSIWNLETGELAEILPGGGLTVYACQFSADSRFLAAATLAGTVKVWGVKKWTLEVSLYDPKRQVWCVAFSPDGRWLATGGSDRTLLVTDTKTWETAVEKPNQDRWVHGVAFSPDGKMLYSATGSWDPADQPAPSTLSAWRLVPGKDRKPLELELVKSVSAHATTSDNLVVTPDSQFVVTGSGDGRIKVWEAKTLAAVRTIRAPSPVHRIQLMRNDPAQLIFGDHFGGLYVCNIRTGAMLADYAGHAGHVLDVTSTIDGRLVISAGDDDYLLFWPGPTRGPDEKWTRFLKQAADKD